MPDYLCLKSSLFINHNGGVEVDTWMNLWQWVGGLPCPCRGDGGDGQTWGHQRSKSWPDRVHSTVHVSQGHWTP